MLAKAKKNQSIEYGDPQAFMLKQEYITELASEFSKKLQTFYENNDEY